ncbi:hypothetical protein GCM10022225_22280 [Plantactinospora mayteni]|uniref:Peptidase MA superfamily n=1 Tax=Plantactinospora mayteni TaxID=566021 RepID=A0ABQ4EP63_9ACTN|nr:hypothetical protein [Plantactinospora mayteni]GIG96410.1 hypothetical protein Pma05_29830 [Plantactinospora mayteni]
MTDGEYRDRPAADHQAQTGYPPADHPPSGYPPSGGYQPSGSEPAAHGLPPVSGYPLPPTGYQPDPRHHQPAGYGAGAEPPAGYQSAGSRVGAEPPASYQPGGSRVGAEPPASYQPGGSGAGAEPPAGYQPAGYQSGQYPPGPVGYPARAGYPVPDGYPVPGGYPGPGGYPVPAGLVPPPRRRRWPLWVGLGTVVALLLCAAPVAIGAVLLDRVSGPGGGAGAAASPKAGDPASVTGDWLTEQIRGLLDGQAKALLGGDENGYVGLAEPNTAIARQLRRDFRTLRAMRVSKWEPKLLGRVSKLDTSGEWRANLTVGHCFVSPGCEPNEITMVTRWKDAAGQPRLFAIDTDSTGGPGRPRPWESDELVASIGERTLVAAPRAFRDRLPDLLREGERAAKVADRYAVDGSPPERYLIFYAGPNEWSRWYGGNRPDWTAGYAVPVGEDQYDLVLNSKAVVPGQYADLMRHELTHASSLAGAERIDDDAWWLVEGIAEQAAAGGRAASRYDSLDDVDRLVNSGWNGELADVAPSDGSEDWHVAGSYGVGYLAVRHLVDRFGEKDVLTFFKLVVHDGKSEADASQEAFGQDWAKLHDECVAYVKKTAS